MKQTLKDIYIFGMIGLLLLAVVAGIGWGLYSEYQKYQYRKAVIELANKQRN